MRQQIDLRCLQSSVSSPLTLERAAAEQLRTCKINKKGKGPHLFQNKREKVPMLFLHLEHLLLRRHWKQYRHIPNNLCESTQPWVSSFLKIPVQFCLGTWLFSLESRKHNIFKCVHTKLPSKMLIQCLEIICIRLFIESLLYNNSWTKEENTSRWEHQILHSISQLLWWFLWGKEVGYLLHLRGRDSFQRLLTSLGWSFFPFKLLKSRTEFNYNFEKCRLEYLEVKRNQKKEQGENCGTKHIISSQTINYAQT